MEKCKQSEEILAEIYRNSQLARQSISNLLPEVQDETIKEELEREYEEYERISTKAQMLAKNKGLELKEPNPFKRAMMWGSIKMNAMKDNSRSHIAEMMVQGTVMGITALKSSAGDTFENADPDVTALLHEFIGLEEELEKKWKGYL